MTTPKNVPPEAQALNMASLLVGMNPENDHVVAFVEGCLVIVVRPQGPVEHFIAAVDAVQPASGDDDNRVVN